MEYLKLLSICFLIIGVILIFISLPIVHKVLIRNINGIGVKEVFEEKTEIMDGYERDKVNNEKRTLLNQRKKEEIIYVDYIGIDCSMDRIIEAVEYTN